MKSLLVLISLLIFITPFVYSQDISLEPYCKNGYYEIPGEPICSRAPYCGGYGYDELNVSSKTPPHQSCVGDQAPNGHTGCAGYVPLCCYEVARTGDFTKCIGYWERLWCAKSQCDTARTKGASDSQCGGNCQCGHAHKSYCGENAQPVALSVRLGNNTATPTSQPQATNTPAVQPTNPPQNYSCPTSSSRNYDKRSIRNVGDRQPAENHPDKNIKVRGYVGTDQEKQIVFNGGDRDNKAPQFSSVLPNSKPAITRLFQIYNWNWGQGNDWGSKGGPQTSPWPVSVMGLSANPGDVIMLADSGYNVIDGYEAYVLYANETSITVSYLNNDRVVGDNGNGYALHYDEICVDPNLLSLYRSLNSQGRKDLPVLSGKQVLGNAKTSEIIVSMRDSGEFMDPRSDAWWLGIQSLPTGQPPQNPTPTTPPNTTTAPTATYTPPPNCSQSNIPQFTAPQGNSVISGIQYNISWTTPAGSSKYYLRINDTGINGEENRFSGNCGVTQFPGDICVDNLSSNVFQYTFQDNHKYALWVHSAGSCGFSDAGSVTITASASTTSCTIQGYKLDVSSNTPSPETAATAIMVRSTDGTIQYSSSTNPYSFSVPGNKDYEVVSDVQTGSGYNAGSTLCINKTDCHNVSDQSYTSGTTRNFRCPASGFADLWWHYQKNSACQTPLTPVITKVTAETLGIFGNVTDGIAYWESPDKPTVPHTYKVELSTDNMQSWQTVAHNYKNTYYGTFVSLGSSPCYRITAINNCGTASAPSAPKCADVPVTPTLPPGTPYPTPTLRPTTTELQCYGTQHCTNGNTTMFEYCGDCTGEGCAGMGFACRSSDMTCKTYPGKVFFFDNVYPIKCSLLTPTPTNSPLPQLTCANCDARQPYLCSTIAATGSGRAATTFCHDSMAPASSYSCRKCDIPTPSVSPTKPVQNITFTPPQQITFVEKSDITRIKIGNLLERITIQWQPIREGYPKLDISRDGVTWENRLSGNDAYPYNYYTTTITDSVAIPVLVRMSVVTPDGQQSALVSQIIDPLPEAPTPTQKPLNIPLATSAPIAPSVLAIGGILVAVVVAGFMIGI